jgi:hypothetical protein
VSLRLVNTLPGDISDPVVPGKPVHLGLKSETLSVDLGLLKVDVATSGLVHAGLLPGSDPGLLKRASWVALETSEHRLPYSGTDVSLATPGGHLTLTKNSNSNFERGVYEVSFPIETRSSVLGFFRILKKSWTLFTPDWFNLSSMAGVYLGLEVGTFNTAAFLGLRGVGAGSIVVGGPLASLNSARPGQVEFPFAWTGLADDSVIDLYVLFNTDGYKLPPASGVPTGVPVVEIWGKLPSDAAPVVLGYIAVSLLGQFPDEMSHFSNYRKGVSTSSTLYFGNIGKTGDVVDLADWGAFSDYRIAVREGQASPLTKMTVLPDAPVRYDSASGLSPVEIVPGRWQVEGGMVAELKYAPGLLSFPTHLESSNTPGSPKVFFKNEPRLAAESASGDGFMIEAMVSGESIDIEGDCPNLSFGAEDETSRFQLSLLETATRKTVGVHNGGPVALLSSFYTPNTPINWALPQKLRLAVDRRRQAVMVMVNEEVLFQQDLASTFPTSANSRVFFGHPNSVVGTSKLKLVSLNYLPRYKAWEWIDGETPDSEDIDSEISFFLDRSDAGTSVMQDGWLRLEKLGTDPDSRRFYSKDEQFGEDRGMQVDFQVGAVFTANVGTTTRMNSGVGLTVRLGTKSVNVRFFNCGVYGNVVGIVPGSGSEQDIIDQTPLGRKFSKALEWAESTKYRLVVKGYEAIELWASGHKAPIITIPWQDEVSGFDLPVDVSTPGLSFGHFSESTTSVSLWSYIRWGMSNGYEVSLSPEYPEGPKSTLFGGKALVMSEFTEQ